MKMFVLLIVESSFLLCSLVLVSSGLLDSQTGHEMCRLRQGFNRWMEVLLANFGWVTCWSDECSS